MPEGLYDRDILVWAERQATLLRRLASGERLNDAIDWDNVIEEIESVGRSELHACESHLRHALVHLIKQHRWPDAQTVPHWRGETVGFLINAERSFAPSMRQKIDLPTLYGLALKQVMLGSTDLGREAPAACPYSLEDLLDPELDVPRLVSLLGPA